MSIVAMKHLRLIALRRDREDLLRQLQRLGCVEIEGPAPPGEDALPAGMTRPDTAAMAQAREEETTLESALAILKRYAPAKATLLAPAPEVSEEALFDQQAYAAALTTAKELADGEKELTVLRARAAKLREQQAALEPWREIDIPLDTPSTKSLSVIFGGVNATAPWDQMEAEVGAATELAQLIRAGRSKDQQCLLLLCHVSAEEEALRALKPYGFTRAALKGWTGTAAEDLRRVGEELAEIERRRQAAEADMAGRGAERSSLQLALDRVRQELRREQVKEKLWDTDATFVLEGWFPAEDQEKVMGLLEKYTTDCEVTDPTEDQIPRVPVKLKNGKLSRSMNTITEMYSLPAYDGIDPNPLMFPFFVVFFGMMMADMAYGLIMIAASLVVLKKTRPRRSTQYFMEGVLWCGISTLLWGAMTGGFFGDLIPQFIRLIDPTSTFEMPALFTPLDDTIAILLGSLVLGAIQVFTGMTISVVKKISDGQFLDALFDEITWWIILAGTGLAILGVGTVGGVPVVLVVGALMLTLGGTRSAKGFGKLTSLVGLVYNGVSGFFSDILSYLRLMALMLAGSVIAQVFNTLAAVVGSMVPVVGLVLFFVVSLLGNSINLALNLLGCYVHDLRLQCLEFFNRFYKEGGKPFRPLNIETKYVDILKEEL